MAERLRGATSPYLLQHADNPVDWWQWGDEAFAEARRRDVPVLLSVGYSACHWCHVMAHESFEDAETAGLMNSRLVSIKVDREERPDVDAVYMTATQAMTGQGGWPMTVFMTPDREPFYCGTYYPREHFGRLIVAISQAWADKRDDVTGQARQIAAALAETSERGSVGGAGGLEDAAGLGDAAVVALGRRYDARRGGYGGAPKFPPSPVLEFLLRRSERSPGLGPEAVAGPEAGAVGERALAMAAGTAEAMARGGIYDQLGGGFARYSVDADWIVPHFEKMLYDNAQLARVYAHWWRRLGWADVASSEEAAGLGPLRALARRVAEQTCDWMIADLTTGEGGFASALDADSEGVEGAFYAWTPGELADVLGAQDGEYAAELFGVTAQGTFEHGKSVLRLLADPAGPDGWERYADVRSRLLAARVQRVWPGRDDKVVAAWNGMAIGALAEAGLLFGRSDYVAAAQAAAELLARVHLSGGGRLSGGGGAAGGEGLSDGGPVAGGLRLARTSRDGVAGGSAGVLEDYACVAAGFLSLAGVDGDARWVRLAGELLDVALDGFRSDSGGFYDTASDSEQLIYRPADPADGPTPSGTFAIAGALLSYSALTGSARHREAAEGALAAVAAIAPKYPQAAGWGLAVAEAFVAGPAEIAIVGDLGDVRTKALHTAAAFGAPPGAVLAIGPGAEAGAGSGGAAEAGAGDGAGAAGGGAGAAGAGAGGGAGAAHGAAKVGVSDGSTGADVPGVDVPGPEVAADVTGRDEAGAPIPLLAGRGLVDGQPAAYVCRNFACRLPVTTPGDLLATLSK